MASAGRTSSLRKARLLIGAGLTTMMLAAIVALAVPASGHEVSGISANCSCVTIGWTGFPHEGVAVHIEANVGSAGTVSKDVMVDDTTGPTRLDISQLAAQLSPIERSEVDVDVTWNYEGPQDAHAVLPVRCGQHVTTTSAGTIETLPASSTSVSTTFNTVANSNETSTSTSTVVTNGSAATTSTFVVSAAEATQTPGPSAAVSGGSLPFTGSPALPLGILGAALVAAGAFLARGARRRPTAG